MKPPRTPQRGVPRRAVLAAGTVVFLAACSDGGAGTTDGGTDTTSDATTGADAGERDPNAVLRYVYYNAPGSYDPHKASSGFHNAPLFIVYDRLVHQAPNGDPAPGLATDWEFSDDALTLTMHLREGVTFHDGEPFNAEAAKANIDRAKTVDGSAVAADMTNIESVDVVDDLTIAIHLAQPAVSTPLLLSDRAGAMVSPAAFDDPNLGVHPVGAGMYAVLEDFEPGVSITLTRFEEYWDPEANLLGGVRIDFNSDATARFNALASGAADVVGINPDQIEQAEGAGLNVVSGWDLTWGSLTFNPDLLEPLADERVRMAINLAIDRQAIVDGIFFGQAEPASQLFPEGYFAHSPDVVPYPYDVERARELMAEAGYADGFSVTFLNVPDPIRQRVGEAIAGQLAEINITAEVIPTESNVQAQMYITDKTAMAQNNAWSGRADPALTIAPNYLEGGWQNPGNVTSPVVTDLYNQAEAATDPAQRAELLQQLSLELVEHPLSVFPTYRPKTSVATHDQVMSLESWMSGKTEFRGVWMTQ